MLTEWIKPNGVRVDLNDEEATIKFAKKNGYKRYDETPEGLAEAQEILAARERRAEATVMGAQASNEDGDAKRKRRTNAEMEADGDK